MSILKRILILMWALSASLLTLYLLGFTYIYSTLFGVANFSIAVDVSFIIFTIIYTLIFLQIFKTKLSAILAILALIPPFALLWCILALG